MEVRVILELLSFWRSCWDFGEACTFGVVDNLEVLKFWNRRNFGVAVIFGVAVNMELQKF